MPYKDVHYLVDDSLISGSDVDLFDIIAPAYWSLSTSGPAEYRQSMAGFTDEQRYLCAIYVYREEVCNGGHTQYWHNSSGITWLDARAGLTAIGADSAASLLGKAARRMWSVSPQQKDRQARLRTIERLSSLLRRIGLGSLAADFDALDSRFYEIKGNLDALMIAYARSCPDQFAFDGTIRQWVRPENVSPELKAKLAEVMAGRMSIEELRAWRQSQVADRALETRDAEDADHV